MKTEGLTEVSQLLARLGEKAQDVATGALFDGAAVVGDAFSAAVGSIRTAAPRKHREGGRRLPTPEEKAAIMGKTGIATFRKNGGEVDTIVGVTGAAGYAQVGGKQKAVREIARSINSGTSFMQKQPVFRKAVSASKSAAEGAIVAKAENMFNEIING